MGGHNETPDSGLERAEQDFRAAARSEAEEDERQAALLAIRRRSLADVAFEAMSRGDYMAAAVGERTFTGRVVYTSGDLLTLDARAATVDVNLHGPVSLRVVEPARSGGGKRLEGPGSFRGRLLELEAHPEAVEVGSPLLPAGLRGKIQVAAQDHLVFRDATDQEWFVPLSWIGYVARVKEE